jgi:hypothetical protein
VCCRDRIAQNVNADEATVLGDDPLCFRGSIVSLMLSLSLSLSLPGAAFYGAGLSRQFRTKEIKVNDVMAHGIQASYFAAPSAANVRPRTINTVIFPAGSRMGTKKTLTFKRKEDFSVWLDYVSPPAS